MAGIHPDRTAHRAVDACGGTHHSSAYPDYASGFDDALDAACEAVKKVDALMAEMLEALREGRRAIGDHFAPNDCYATGPLTGEPFRDLVQCPACSFISMYEQVVARASGEAVS